MIQIQNQLPTKENDGLEELKRFCANTHTHTRAIDWYKMQAGLVPQNLVLPKFREYKPNTSQQTNQATSYD